MPPKKIREAAGPNFAYQGKIPENFSFVDSEWEKWLRTFERYRKVSRLFAEPEDIQVSTLILTMGTKAETILETFNLSIREEESYDSVIQSFNKYFAKKINVIYERAKFNRRYQFENEPVSEFITSLQELSMSCKYGPLREELLRDRIVVGIRDSGLSAKLQMDSELTLEKAIDGAKDSETVKSQQKFIRYSHDPNEELCACGISSKFQKKPFSCYRCGSSEYHNFQTCKAKDATCKSCGKIGHFAAVCRSPQKAQKLHEIANDFDPNDDNGSVKAESIILGSITIGSVQSLDWFVQPFFVEIDVDGFPIQFKIDTGADITCIPVSLFKKLNKKERDLVKYKGAILHAGKGNLGCLGTFTAQLQSSSGKKIVDRLFVIENLGQPLLGRPAIKHLNLVSINLQKKVLNVEVENSPEFKSLFADVPKAMIGDPYEIKLISNPNPLLLPPLAESHYRCSNPFRRSSK
ncbi:tetratricopeptide repeat protein, tpr [Nesidiocoris tenuis]|uniref:Tetratricopeptide repeat protein, tpr n=2 Tax=Nesidiocoris tenuis TaxID=355587 RepID=A0ABN7AVA4_9HEMI|nr:tetratricopeptide repeat protein, tpr [Nesidiocoris tenuis]